MHSINNAVASQKNCLTAFFIVSSITLLVVGILQGNSTTFSGINAVSMLIGAGVLFVLGVALSLYAHMYAQKQKLFQRQDSAHVRAILHLNDPVKKEPYGLKAIGIIGKDYIAILNNGQIVYSLKQKQKFIEDKKLTDGQFFFYFTKDDKEFIIDHNHVHICKKEGEAFVDNIPFFKHNTRLLDKDKYYDPQKTAG
jgi:hypothetical protein